MTPAPPEVNRTQEGWTHKEWRSPNNVDEVKARRSAPFCDRIFLYARLKKRPKKMVSRTRPKIFNLTAGLNQ